MPKTFFTERDIEDLFQRGGRSITVTEDIVLTELAYEKARQLGIELLQSSDTPPAAPIRPYLNQPSMGGGPVDPALHGSHRLEELKIRVKEAVAARLGAGIDPALIDKIIERVAADIGLK